MKYIHLLQDKTDNTSILFLQKKKTSIL